MALLEVISKRRQEAGQDEGECRSMLQPVEEGREIFGVVPKQDFRQHLVRHGRVIGRNRCTA